MVEYCPYCMNEASGSSCKHCGKPLHWEPGINQLPAGTMLDGSGLHRYLTGAAIGQGGFGITYIAVEPDSGRRVAVIGLSADAPEEAEYLRQIGCEVEYFDEARAKKYAVSGGERAERLTADGVAYAVDCVFILRPALAPTDLFPGLETEKGFVAVDRHMATNLPGLFAAGDCTGGPLQAAKAAGEGLIAGQSAAAYVADLERQARQG